MPRATDPGRTEWLKDGRTEERTEEQADHYKTPAEPGPNKILI